MRTFVMGTERTALTLGKALQAHRMRAGLSQLELAARASIGVRTLRNLEQDRVARPRAPSLRGLAAALRLSGADADALLALATADTTPPDDEIRIEVLGPLTVSRGLVTVEIASTMLRRLLGLLALRPDGVVLPGEIVDVLWEHDPPKTCRSLIQVYVGQLRRVLEPERVRRAPGRILTLTAGGYRLRLDRERIDLARFEDLAGHGLRAWEDGDPRTARDLLDRALAYWRGPVLADLGEQLRHHPVAVAAARRHATAALAYADLAVDPGDSERALARLRVLAHEEPLHEGVSARLGLALAKAGEQAAALALFDQVRARLADELGIEPGPELRAAHLQVLRQQVPGAGQPAKRPRPAELPADVAGFTGREALLDELDYVLRKAGGPSGSPRRLLAVTGSGGVGKTALAVHWAHRVRDEFPDGQLYVNLRGFAVDHPLRPIEALTGFLHALGCAHDQVPVETDHAAALYRSLLADKRMLVVLDNGRNAQHVRPLLPGSAGCLTLVTSRDRLAGLVARDGAHRVPVDVLTAAEAGLLLECLVGTERVGEEPAAAAELVELCDHLPLALRIAGANVTGRAGGLAGCAARLRTGNRLAALAADSDEQDGVRATFDLSYAALPAEERRLFRLLGLVPGPDTTPAAAAALTGATPAEAADSLDRLAAAHLVEERAAGRYGLHDLLRIYAAERAVAEDGDAGTREATARLFDMYLHTADAAARVLYPHMVRLPLPRPTPSETASFPRHTEALHWLDEERHNLIAVVDRAAAQGPMSTAWALADVLHGYFLLRMFTVDWLAVAEHGRTAARAAGDPMAEAACELSLANAWMRTSHHQPAIEHANRALVLTQRIDWLEGQAAVVNNLGIVHWQSGQLQRAVAHLTHALALNRRTENAHGEAANLGNLAVIHRELGRLRMSAAHVTTANAITRRISYPIAEANGQASLGRLAHDLGRFDTALALLTTAVRLYRELGSQGGEADALSTMARVFTDAGRITELRAIATTAVTLAAGVSERQVEAGALNTLATICRRLGDHEEATDHARRALTVAVATGNRYPEIEALVELSNCHRRQPGGTAEAVEYGRQALNLSRLGGYRVLEAQALTSLAAAHLVLGRPDRALPEAWQAVETQRETGHRLGEAQATQVLSQALRATHQPAAAASTAHQAATLFEQLGVQEISAAATEFMAARARSARRGHDDHR
jgi:DNA-binding SARP family transcriptional activator/tetratricopeptide (TPR) repeat protein